MLFTALTLRGVTFRNRVWVSPMCQYSSVDGLVGDWHLVHLGSMARGGAGLVMTEATAVNPEGRISPSDAGLWNDEHTKAWRRITDFIHGQGAAAGIQLAHAGRKASTWEPSRGVGSVTDGRGWTTVAPSAIAFDGVDEPVAMSIDDIGRVVEDWRAAAKRAVEAGFDVIEIHAAHGYLLNEFLSPLTNLRTDSYGGSLENRSRILIEIVDAIRVEVPDTMPVFVRLSASEWVDGGLDVAQIVKVCRVLKDHGVDLIDVSSGGNSPSQRIAVGPGYQVPFARQIREEAQIPVAAVGLITTGAQADQILNEGSADAIFIGRAMLRDTSWALHAAAELGADVPWPTQYVRARA